MIGVLRIAESEWPSMRLVDLVVRYDAAMIDEWDRVALLASIQYNLMVVTANANGCKPPAQPREFLDFHPFRSGESLEKRGVIKDIGALKVIGDTLVNQNRG